MKLSIDAFNIALPHGTGVATYGRNLAKVGASLEHDVGILFGTKASNSRMELLNEVAIAEGDSQLEKQRASLPIRIRTGLRTIAAPAITHNARTVPFSGKIILPTGLRLSTTRFWNVPELYKTASLAFRFGNVFTKVRLDSVDLAHWTYPLPVLATGACNIYTLHDLVPLKLPYTTADHKRAYYRLCKRIARTADHILTVSESARQDIIEILGVEERRITNLYQSSDAVQTLKGVSEEEIQRYVEGLLGVGMRGYFLFFGAIEPKKNIARMIEAYLGSASNTPLVIVGAPGWGGENDVKLLKSMVSLDTRKRIIWLGYLPREMLVMLIAGARATLFPSLYEGFGLPVLESMSLGTPVITSNVSSLPEVAGDAALLVDPYDVRSIANAIMTIDRDQDLWTELAHAGTAQAARFNDHAYEQRLREFYGTIR